MSKQFPDSRRHSANLYSPQRSKTPNLVLERRAWTLADSKFYRHQLISLYLDGWACETGPRRRIVYRDYFYILKWLKSWDFFIITNLLVFCNLHFFFLARLNCHHRNWKKRWKPSTGSRKNHPERPIPNFCWSASTRAADSNHWVWCSKNSRTTLKAIKTTKV